MLPVLSKAIAFIDTLKRFDFDTICSILPKLTTLIVRLIWAYNGSEYNVLKRLNELKIAL